MPGRRSSPFHRGAQGIPDSERRGVNLLVSEGPARWIQPFAGAAATLLPQLPQGYRFAISTGSRY